MRIDDIADAFKAIAQEAQALQALDLPEAAKSGLAAIVSIARHQKDIRQSPAGTCKAGKANP